MDSSLIFVAGCAVWSFAIWGLVAFAKSITRSLKWPWLDSAWKRFQALYAPVIGAATGPLALRLILYGMGIEIPELPSEISSRFLESAIFLGIGAGGVASTMHEAVLWRFEHLIKGKE